MFGVFIDPAWAVPANTALLVVLTVLNFWHNRRTAQRTTDVHAEVVDVKRAVGVNRRADDECPMPAHPTAPAPHQEPKRWTDQEDTL